MDIHQNRTIYRYWNQIEI